MNPRIEFEAYRSTIEELKISGYHGRSRALRWTAKFVAESLGVLFHLLVVRLFDSPEGITAKSNELIEEHKRD